MHICVAKFQLIRPYRSNFVCTRIGELGACRVASAKNGKHEDDRGQPRGMHDAMVVHATDFGLFQIRALETSGLTISLYCDQKTCKF